MERSTSLPAPGKSLKNIGWNGPVSRLIGFDAAPIVLRCEFGQMKFANEGREHVRGFEIVVVVRAIEVGWHDAQKPCAILAIVGFTQFNSGDFRDGIGFVGGFKKPG